MLPSCAKSTVEGLIKLPTVKETILKAKLDSINRSRPSFFSAKTTVKLKSDKQNTSFDASIKIKQDSAIYTIIKALGVPMAVGLLNNDSIKFTNRKEKCYFVGSANFLEQKLAYALTRNDLEDLILAKAVYINAVSELEKIKDKYHYLLSNMHQVEGDSSLYIVYELSADLNHIANIYAKSLDESMDFKISYSDYGLFSEYNIPKQVEISARIGSKHFEINLHYKNIEINDPSEFIVVIPDSYEVCK